MPVGSFFLTLSLPLVWGGFADDLWRRMGIRRELILLLLGALLFLRLAAGGMPVVATALAALPAALALVRPPAGRMRRLGFLLVLAALAAMGAIEMACLPFVGLDPVIWAPVTLGLLAGVWGAGPVSAFGMGALAGLAAFLLPLGPEAPAADAFQLVWGSALLGGWAGLAVERALRAAKRPVSA